MIGLHGKSGNMNMNFYSNKRVFVTGGTGFKGSWLCKLLSWNGAKVMNYALPPENDINLYDIAQVNHDVTTVLGDIRDFEKLYSSYSNFKPDLVFHLAAQPLVRESYQSPRYTYETNVMGTVNILDCVRKSADSYCSVLNVTTDKVYENQEWIWGYRENEPLNGHDPYSNSKSCSELVTSSYRLSFFNEQKIPVSTARAGNVIGGGDFAKDRILPDCIRGASAGKPVIIRNPNSVRPYQHVLESLYAYLMIGAQQYENIALAGSYNVGPDVKDCIDTKTLADLFCHKWGNGAQWVALNDKGPHESNFLKLDCSRLKETFHWKPVWDVEMAVEKTIEFSKAYMAQQNINEIMKKQAHEYYNEFQRIIG
jgi:CDP-glucose 4,6-dehydratase